MSLKSHPNLHHTVVQLYIRNKHNVV